MSAGSFTRNLHVLEKGPKARFSSPYLNRWSQPDTIVPNQHNPQSLNRYSYVLNKPITLTDSSGHLPDQYKEPETCLDGWICMETEPHDYSQDPDLYLFVYAGLTYNQLVKDKDPDAALEAFARTVEKADEIYDKDDTEGFLNGLNKALASTPYKSGPTGSVAGLQYYRNKYHGIAIDFDDSGFHPDFQDGHNQVFHAWSAMITTMQSPFVGSLVIDVGNIWHEPGEYIAGIIYGVEKNEHNVQSWRDYFLTVAAADIGRDFALGLVNRSDLGNEIRSKLGNSGFGSYGRVSLFEFFTPLNYPFP